MKVYGVRNGLEGCKIYNTWSEAKNNTDGVSNARVKAFSGHAEAEQYIRDDFYAANSQSLSSVKEDARGSSKRTLHQAFEAKPTAFKADLTTLKADLTTFEAKAACRKDIVIFTDGACPRNGQKALVGGAGVFFGKDDPRNISERVEGPDVTNNYVELLAIQRALEFCSEERRKTQSQTFTIYTDSIYCLNICKTWRHGWKLRGWTKTDGTPVLNIDLVKKIHLLLEHSLFEIKLSEIIRFFHVKGHSGIEGNEAADRLATSACF